MTNYTLFKLCFTAPLHLAKGKTDYDSAEDMLHSDALKSALAVCGLQLGLLTDVMAFLESFKISSAFPFFKETYFFPKPNFLDGEKSMHRITGMEEAKQRKLVKKIKWVEKALFEDLISSKVKAFHEDYFNGAFLSNLPKDTQIYKSETQERVQIPRVMGEGEDTKPYYVDRLYFHEHAGLFFLLDTQDEKIVKQIESCLKLLGDNGLGTDRNVGNGQFVVEKVEDFNLPEVPNANAKINLSLYCPLKEELEAIKNDTKVLAYTLLKRGGWIASPQNLDHISLRKKSVFMFGEGSIFPSVGLAGKIADLKPDILKNEHEIFRDGTSIFLPIAIK